MYALVDCNSFYASCEKVFRPDLRDKPVVVLSNNDGCIIARSKEAKDLGIAMGEPFFKIKDRLKGVTSFSANFSLYGDLSARVMDTLASFTPDIEVYSIDEAFLYFESCRKLMDLGRQIQYRVQKHIGIPVSVGFGRTKTLAKLANYWAKTHDGVWVVTQKNYTPMMKTTAVSKVWGVGRQFSNQLLVRGVRSVDDFIRMPEVMVQKLMHLPGLRTHKELKGIPCYGLDDPDPLKKGITSSRSFGKKTDKLEALEGALSENIAMAAYKLRKQRLVAPVVSVFIMTSRHREGHYSRSAQVRLAEPTDCTITLSKAATQLVQSLYLPDKPYSKSGVMLLDLVPKSQGQLSLFSAVPKPSGSLMKAMDRVNRRFGSKTIGLGTSSLQNRVWKMNQEHLSPRYTTSIRELPEVMIL